MITGISCIIFIKDITSFIIYHHTSTFITIIGWFILSKREAEKSSYFFIGSTCANITYFLAVKNRLKKDIFLILILFLFYFPVLDIAYDMQGFLFLTLSIFIILLYFKVDKFFFKIVVCCFIGTCIMVGTFVYWKYGVLFGKFGGLCIFLVSTLGIYLNKSILKIKSSVQDEDSNK